MAELTRPTRHRVAVGICDDEWKRGWESTPGCGARGVVWGGKGGPPCLPLYEWGHTSSESIGAVSPAVVGAQGHRRSNNRCSADALRRAASAKPIFCHLCNDVIAVDNRHLCPISMALPIVNRSFSVT
ncbi:unnamed protein product, partial [Iphiclides podalirius]